MTTLPIHTITQPSALRGTVNGQLPHAILTTHLGAGPKVTLVDVAMRAWLALSAAADAFGVPLYATGVTDSYRDYDAQVALFLARYTKTRLAGRPSKSWGGATWWQIPGTAEAAVPGTSNHGYGLAVDVANTTGARLAWLLAHAWDYGWSWELQSEPWHLRYCTGDNTPPAVQAYEATETTDMDYNQAQKLDAVYNAYPTVHLDTTTKPADGTGHLQEFAVPFTKRLDSIDQALAELKRLITKTSP